MIAFAYTLTELETMPFQQLTAIELAAYTLYDRHALSLSTFAFDKGATTALFNISEYLHDAYRAIRTVYLNRYISEGHYQHDN